MLLKRIWRKSFLMLVTLSFRLMSLPRYRKTIITLCIVNSSQINLRISVGSNKDGMGRGVMFFLQTTDSAVLISCRNTKMYYAIQFNVLRNTILFNCQIILNFGVRSLVFLCQLL